MNLNKYQKVINQITKTDMQASWNHRKTTFRKLRVKVKNAVRDLDFEELVIYKNLG